MTDYEIYSSSSVDLCFLLLSSPVTISHTKCRTERLEKDIFGCFFFEREGGAYEHLGDLDEGDKAIKASFELEYSESRQEVVEVHDSMDEVVHAGEPNAGRNNVVERVPAVE